MVKYSRFSHSFDLGDSVALYHSLRMKPVYLRKDIYEGLQEWLAGPFCISFESVPTELKETVEQLKKYKVLSDKENEDKRVLDYIQSKVPGPHVNVCYMILSEQCNLAGE